MQGNALQRLVDWFGGGVRPEGIEVAAKGRAATHIMTSPVLTVTPETPTAEAIRLMMAHKVKRRLVVDTSGHLVGMIGRAAVLSALGRGSELRSS